MQLKGVHSLESVDLDLNKEKTHLQSIIEEIKHQLASIAVQIKKYWGQALQVKKSMWQDQSHTVDSFDEIIEMAQELTNLTQTELYKDLYDKRAKRLVRMANSPYFGRIDFVHHDNSQKEQLYIGLFSLTDSETNRHLVYDWRAPISSMFYDYELGPAQYTAEAGTITGEILLKRQYKIAHGQLEYMFDSSIKIDDEILQRILSRTVDDRMKSIVTSIQREQNKIIRDENHDLLIVLGPAGSGKTSIALHRIAYLYYKNINLKPENVLIISPNKLFSHYISDVLPELGEDNTLQVTFDEYVQTVLKKDYSVQTHSQLMEYLFTEGRLSRDNLKVQSLQFKNSRTFLHILDAYIAMLYQEGLPFKDIVYKDRVIVSKEELKKLFAESYIFLPYIKRLEKIRQRVLYLLDPIENNRFKELMIELDKNNKENNYDRKQIKMMAYSIVTKEFAPIKEWINSITAVDLYTLYYQLFADKSLLNRLGSDADELPGNLDKIRKMTTDHLKQHYISYEDIAPILYLQSQLQGLPGMSGILHIVVDEAQDYSPVQFEVIRSIAPDSSLILLGDRAQAINPYLFTDDFTFLMPEYANAILINLKQSYRSTKEIAQFCQAMIPSGNGFHAVDRHGPLPSIIKVCDEKELVEAVLKEVDDFRKRHDGSMAIICKNLKQSKSLYEAVKNRLPVSLITGSEEGFDSSIVIIPVYLAKGLEFDQVLVYQASEDYFSFAEEWTQLYTACSRALHNLKIIYHGQPSLFLPKDQTLFQSVTYR
jgi:DNA helicase-2/ATP-dependent DNA helicase PcrA